MGEDLRKWVESRRRVAAMRRRVVGIKTEIDFTSVEDTVAIAVHPEADSGAGRDDGEGERGVKRGQRHQCGQRYLLLLVVAVGLENAWSEDVSKRVIPATTQTVLHAADHDFRNGSSDFTRFKNVL